MDWCIILNQISHGHLSMKWLKREIIGHKKKVLSHELLSKKYYAFFSFLSFFVSLFLSFFLSFFLCLFVCLFFSFFLLFFLENEQCEKCFFFFIVFWSPFFRFSANFFEYFSWQVKQKNKKKWAQRVRQSGKCESTYLCTLVWETNLYLFFFLALGIT